MADPLSPASSSTLNRGNGYGSTSSFDVQSSVSDQTAYMNEQEQDLDDPPSSPFIVEPINQENCSPAKVKSPRKPSPVKQRPAKLPVHAFGDVSRSDGPVKPTETLDDTRNYDKAGDDDTICTMNGKASYGDMDDTTFSTFSAVPNVDMTQFARLGTNRDDYTQDSPAKQLRMESYARYNDPMAPTPNRRGVPSTPGTARQRYDDSDHSPSPTPRRRQPRSGDDETTNLILDFTEQFHSFSRQGSPTKSSRRSPSKSHTQPDLGSFMSRGRTPSPRKQAYGTQSNLANLLDFDIPPPPTPRSVPTITARELESLKSGYLSQISSLKATLSGKTAEVSSLKEAVGDAERRVGEAMEIVREERGARESLQEDKDSWEKRGKEMENVLRSVKEEILREEREKDRLAHKLEESERKREEAETRTAEIESQMAGMRAVSSSASQSDMGNSQASGNTSKEVEAAVEKVARELHGLYKSKHETKVTALKKSYEARWEKRVRELESKLDEVSKENEELRVGRDATMSGVVPRLPTTETLDVRQQQDRAEEIQKSEEQKAKLLGLAEEVASIKRDNAQLLREIETERVEKGELVAAVEEMLVISAAAQAGDQVASSGLENLRGSISRASGLRRPDYASALPGPNLSASFGSSGESRIGRMNSTGSSGKTHSRSGSATSGLTAPRSGIMSNIERMGRGRGDC